MQLQYVVNSSNRRLRFIIVHLFTCKSVNYYNHCSNSTSLVTWSHIHMVTWPITVLIILIFIIATIKHKSDRIKKKSSQLKNDLLNKFSLPIKFTICGMQTINNKTNIISLSERYRHSIIIGFYCTNIYYMFALL